MSNKLLTAAEFEEHIRQIGRRVNAANEIKYLELLVDGQREMLNRIHSLCVQVTCGNHCQSDARWEFALKVRAVIEPEFSSNPSTSQE